MARAPAVNNLNIYTQILFVYDTNFPERAERGDNADIMCIIMRTGIANML